MKASIRDWSLQSIGEIELDEHIFAAPVRKDIILRVIEWQLAKRRSGNHKTKEIGDVSGTTRKPWKQKGTGRARTGSLRSPQFRGGATIFGPVVRSHAFDLPKKVRRLGLKSALSAKLQENSLLILDKISLDTFKTAEFKKKIQSGTEFNSSSILFVDGPEVCDNLKRAISNLYRIDVLPQHGLNVYDIVRHKQLVLSRAAVDYLGEFLK